MTERQQWRQRATARPERVAAAPAAIAGPRHAALTQLAATLDAAPAVARTAATARTLNHTRPPLAAPPVQRVAVDAKRPGWRLDKFDRRDRIYIDLAAKLGGGDDMIEQFEQQFPNLYATHVAPDVEVDISRIAEQAVAGRIAPPTEINQLGVARGEMRGVINSASAALAAARVDHVVQGSGANMLLGAAAHEPPEDVDIITTDMVAGSRALLAAGFTAAAASASGAGAAAAAAGAGAGAAAGGARTTSAGLPATSGRVGPLIAKTFAAGTSSPGASAAWAAANAKAAVPRTARGAGSMAAAGQGKESSLAVLKFTHTKTGKRVDLVMQGEMSGFIKDMDRVAVDGVPTLAPIEAIRSLGFRVGATGKVRAKDIAALKVLVAKHGADFTPQQWGEVRRVLQGVQHVLAGQTQQPKTGASAGAPAQLPEEEWGDFQSGPAPAAAASAAAAAGAVPATPAAAPAPVTPAPLSDVAATPAANKDGQP